MKTLVLGMVLMGVASAAALTPRFVGYAGNSGSTDRPVLLGPFERGDPHGQQTQTGPYFDEQTGLLYMSSARNRLTAYALDGRVEANYTIPSGYFTHTGDPLVRMGDNLIFRRNKVLWQLPLNAPDGTAATKAPCKLTKIRLISSSTKDGELAVLLEDKTLHLWKAETGESRELGVLDVPNPLNLVWNASGDLYAFEARTVHRLEGAKSVTADGFPKLLIPRGVPMFAAYLTGNGLFTGSFSGSLLRLNPETLDLDPGVVFGGAGGHTFVYMFNDSEITMAGGITWLKGDYYAVGGWKGVIKIMKWNAEQRKFERVRRIGALPESRVLELGDDGTIMSGNVGFLWNDPENAVINTSWKLGDPRASARVGKDVMRLGISAFWSAIEAGPFPETGRRPMSRVKDKWNFTRAVGAASGEQGRFYVLDADGACRRYAEYHNPHRIGLEFKTNVVVSVAKPFQKASAFTAMNEKTFVLAAEGRIALVQPDDAGLRLEETAVVGTGFDPACRISAHRDRIAVAEKAKNRVTILSRTGETLATIAVSAPGPVAINANRLVVHDTLHQRLVKYELED